MAYNASRTRMANDPPQLAFRPLSVETFDDFARMHGRPDGQGCYCMYWQFEGGDRVWQLRTGDENRAAKHARVANGTTHAMLAYDTRRDEVVGTLGFEPRDALPKLLARAPYQKLPRDEATWALACFRVVPEARRTGVARGLLRATLTHLREVLGATAVEAFARRDEEVTDEEAFGGPLSLLLAEGFVVVREHARYPVLRRTWEP